MLIVRISPKNVKTKFKENLHRCASHFFPTPNTLWIWSADILVRLFVLVNAQADRNVRAPTKVRSASFTVLAGLHQARFPPAFVLGPLLACPRGVPPSG